MRSFNNDGLTLSYDYNPEYKLTPKEIMDCLTKEPEFIKKIGISAVSSEIMMEWWKDMISLEPNYFDICGSGYNGTSKWRKFNDF